MQLQDIVEIITRDEFWYDKIESIYKIHSENMPKSGYLFETTTNTPLSTLSKNKGLLKQFDIILHNSGDVGIIGNIISAVTIDTESCILRFPVTKDIKLNAISLYMYLKSAVGQKALRKAIRSVEKVIRISFEDLLFFDISLFDKVDSFTNFHKEQELYNELYKINHSFDTFDDKSVCERCECTLGKWKNANSIYMMGSSFTSNIPFGSHSELYYCDNCASLCMSPLKLDFFKQDKD